jgi:hypothetical protein
MAPVDTAFCAYPDVDPIDTNPATARVRAILLKLQQEIRIIRLSENLETVEVRSIVDRDHACDHDQH